MGVADRIGQEAQDWLATADSDYRVQIEHAGSYDWFYLRVFYRDQMICSKACVKRYWFARWRVRRVVRSHRKFVAATRAEGVSYL